MSCKGWCYIFSIFLETKLKVGVHTSVDIERELRNCHTLEVDWLGSVDAEHSLVEGVGGLPLDLGDDKVLSSADGWQLEFTKRVLDIVTLNKPKDILIRSLRLRVYCLLLDNLGQHELHRSIAIGSSHRLVHKTRMDLVNHDQNWECIGLWNAESSDTELCFWILLVGDN